MIKPGNIIRIAVPFIIGAVLMLAYHLSVQYHQIGQLEQLILTNRQLVGVQRLLISNFAESYNVLADCTILLEEKNCNQVIDGQKLDSMLKERNQLIEKMNKLDGKVADIIERNRWDQIDKTTGIDKESTNQ